MTANARIFMFFSFALINLFLLNGLAIKALGVVFLILGIQAVMAKPKTS
jgi:hypothetical protein